MPTRKKPKNKRVNPSKTPQTRPYVSVAALCENVLDEKDGVLSAIRLIDIITISVPTPKIVGQTQLVPIPITILIALKSGSATGRRIITVTLTVPNGQTISTKDTFPVFLEGDEKGANVIIKTNVLTPGDGLFWFNVLLDGELLTRIPLRVKLEWAASDESNSESLTNV